MFLSMHFIFITNHHNFKIIPFTQIPKRSLVVFNNKLYIKLGQIIWQVICSSVAEGSEILGHDSIRKKTKPVGLIYKLNGLLRSTSKGKKRTKFTFNVLFDTPVQSTNYRISSYDTLIYSRFGVLGLTVNLR